MSIARERFDAGRRFVFASGRWFRRYVELQIAMLAGELKFTAGHPKVEFRFRYVAPGSTRLGLTPDEQLRVARGRGNLLAGHNATPSAAAKFAEGYFLLDGEVTCGQYRAITKPSKTDRRGEAAAEGKETQQHRDLPRALVSWREATAFCSALHEATGFTVRLPTEWEWEYAARGPAASLFAAGGEPPHSYGAEDASDRYEAIVGGMSAEGPRKVGASCPRDRSWCGLRDLSGNLSEWCLDEYRSAAFETSGETILFRPSMIHMERNSPHGRERSRSIRGASFDDHVWDAAAPLRRSLRESQAAQTVGFRPAIILPPLDLRKLSR